MNDLAEPQKASDKIDLAATRENLHKFVDHYKTARERAGEPRVPDIMRPFALKQSLSEIEDMLKLYQGLSTQPGNQSFKELHSTFSQGYSAIHGSSEKLTERRRKIFMLRWFVGMKELDIGQRVLLARRMVTRDNSEAVKQFCGAVGMLEYKTSDSQ